MGVARPGASSSVGNKGGRPSKHDALAPPCSRGHVGATVYAEKYYGAKRLRVLYHCKPLEGGRHRYAATLPRVKVDDSTCDVCEHSFTLHDGHQATREYTFTDREIASVLLSLGRGVSHNRAAASIRNEAARPMDVPRHGTLVTNWLDVYAPLVIDAVVKAAALQTLPPAPHSIYVDAKPFKGNALSATGKKLKGGRVRFHVLAAVAHNAQGKPYTIKLWAAKTITEPTWAQFLRQVAACFTGAPKWVVADGEYALVKAVTAVWPTAAQWGCHSHLRTGAEDRLRKAGVTSVTHPAWKTAQAFTGSQASFDKFRTEARQLGDQALLTWLTKIEPVLQGHWREPDPPRSKSAGQTESVLRHVVGKALEGRHRAMHNLPRLQLLLELFRLEENSVAGQRLYQRILRGYLSPKGGRPASYAQAGHVKFTWDPTARKGKRGAGRAAAGRYVPPPTLTHPDWVD